MDFFALSVCSVLLAVMPLVSVTALGAAADVARFGIAQRSLAAVSLISVALGSVYSPEFSRSWQAGDRQRLRATFAQARTLIRLLFLPVAVLVCIWPSQIMGILGGDKASGIPVWVVVVLALGQMTNGAVGLTSETLQMTGKVRADLGATLAAGVGMGLILIWPANWAPMSRAAIGFAVGMCGKNLITAILVQRLTFRRYDSGHVRHARPT